MTEAMKLETTDEALRNALAWYGEQARLARLIHSEGDKGRHALAEDGGKRAREVLSLSASPAGVGVEDVAVAAEFLCQRLEEFERELEDDEVGREYYGHVHPAFARLVAALKGDEQ